MPDVCVRRYKDWDYSNRSGAKRRWFYLVNEDRPASAFDWTCLRTALRIWRRLDRHRRLNHQQRQRRHKQLELFARSMDDDTLKLMMPDDALLAR